MNRVQSTIWIFLVFILAGCGGGSGSDTPTANLQPVTITAKAKAGGSILPVSTSISPGQTATFAISVNDGFEIDQVTGCGGVLSGFNYVTGVVQINCNIEANFRRKIYQVSVVTNEGGKVDQNKIEVLHGEWAQISLSPNPGYVIGDIEGCHGTLAGNQYTTAVVQTNCQINVIFTKQQWMLSSGTNSDEIGQVAGSISPQKVLVSYLDSVEFQIDPLPQFSLKSIEGCSGKLVRNGFKAVFTTDPVAKTCHAIANFSFRPTALGKVQSMIRLGNTLRLDGSDSYDPEGELITYQWSLLQTPKGSTANIDDADKAIGFFVPDIVGHYMFGLTVDDGFGKSNVVQFDLMVTDENSAPLIQFEYVKTHNQGTEISIDASKSFDLDGDDFTFSWKLLKSGHPVLTAGDVKKFVWRADEIGDFMVQLELTDIHGNLARDYARIIVQERKAYEKQPPIAKIRYIGEKATQQAVLLDGRASSGAEGETLSYKWSIVAKPEQSAIKLSSDLEPVASFVPDLEGTYVFSLLVSDGENNHSDSVAVQVRDKSIQMFYQINKELIEILLPFRGFPEVRTINEDNKTISFGKYFIVTKGKDYVIENVEATASGDVARAYFFGLRSGLIIPTDSVHEFIPKSTLVRGIQLELQYKFSVKDTNKNFVLESYFKLP